MSAHIGSGATFGGSALPTIAGVNDQDVNSDINVTPMIDVMLVLLIIFMVVTPALGGYAAILPKAVTSAPEKEDRVTLGIDNQGRYYLDESPGQIPLEQLSNVLRQAYSTRPEDHVLYLKADRGVQYSVVLSAIDAARVAGVRRIGAITEIQSGEEGAE
jgi:biopolymer transport protein TolR